MALLRVDGGGIIDEVGVVTLAVTFAGGDCGESERPLFDQRWIQNGWR